MRVIVIGSGIAGLSAAVALRRVGLDVTVYERAPELREVGAGISLWANALRALDHLGAGAAVRAAAQPLDRFELRADEGRRVLTALPGAAYERAVGYRPAVVMTHRAELVAALAGFLPAGVARYGYECVGVGQNGGRVAARFANGHSDEAEAVIGADGIRSAVRASLFGLAEPRYAGYTCWRGVCPRPPSVEPGYAGEWWGRGKRFGVVTLPGDRVYWFAVANAPTGGHAADERAAAASSFRGWADPVPGLIESTPADRVLRGDILDRPPNRAWAVGRVGLIGDAAHPTTPNLGQGGCLAIEDAVALARVLAADPDPARALAAFTAERYPRAAGVTNDSRRFGAVGQWEGRMSCRLRDRVLGLLLPVVGARTTAKYAAFDVGPLPSPG